MWVVQGVIEASTKVQAAFERVRPLLLAQPKAVIGDRCLPTDRPNRARCTVAVEAPTVPGVTEEVLVELIVELRPTRANHARVAVPLSWEAVGWPRLFPTFTGLLESHRAEAGSQVSLRGTYALPLSPAAQFGEGVAGRRLARQAGAAFLEHAARRIDGDELSHPDLALWHPGAHTVTLAELLASEERVRRQ